MTAATPRHREGAADPEEQQRHVGLTVLTVSSGGLSLMSVMLMRAVAVFDSPKFRLPSMSVAWTMMVYWDTFCIENKRQKTHSEP